MTTGVHEGLVKRIGAAGVAAADGVAGIERATLAALPPRAQEELDGWLLGLDGGTVARARSAVPLSHAAPDPDVVPRIEARYRASGLPPLLRLPQLPAFDALRASVTARGYRIGRPVLVQTAWVAELARHGNGDGVALSLAPDARWGAVLAGEGFDAAEGAARLAVLRRGRDSVFAAVEQQGRVVAVGLGCCHQGWCGIHAMRTAPAWRGRGLARRILAALARQAQAQGIERAFLQVEASNLAAQALYRRAGFITEWVMDYAEAPAAGQD